jgi:hypothetical protein
LVIGLDGSRYSRKECARVVTHWLRIDSDGLDTQLPQERKVRAYAWASFSSFVFSYLGHPSVKSSLVFRKDERFLSVLSE